MAYRIWELFVSGGFIMYPLLLCSIAAWAVILERLWIYSRLETGLRSFQLEAENVVYRKGSHATALEQLRSLCGRHPGLPSSRLLSAALDRLGSADERLRSHWREALERRRLLVNQELRGSLWLLGTIGSSAPFIGLFGTVIGVLASFQDIARTGSGGFAVVASGISQALVATAAGIVVAVISVMAFNAFQTRWSGLILKVKIQAEELAEMLASLEGDKDGKAHHGV